MIKIFEIISTITGILAVSLQAKEKIIAWPIAIISVTIASYVYFVSKLYSDFSLHIIYIILNVYGWVIWSSRMKSKTVVPTKRLNTNSIGLSILITIVGTITLGFIMSSYTDADLPYFDAFTTSGSLVAQFLLAKKYLENWIFWIVVDLVAIPIYIIKGLYFFSFLFAVYLIICIIGYFSWKKEMGISSNTIA